MQVKLISWDAVMMEMNQPKTVAVLSLSWRKERRLMSNTTATA